jgi:hypothetical protein
VLVRAAGFGCLLAGLIDLGHVAFELLGLPIHSNYPVALTLTAVSFWSVLGLLLLAGASLIVRLVYGRDNSN